VEKLCITGARSNMRTFSSLTEPTKIHHHTELYQNPTSSFQLQLKSNFLSTNHLYGSHQHIVPIYSQSSKTSFVSSSSSSSSSSSAICYVLCSVMSNTINSRWTLKTWRSNIVLVAHDTLGICASQYDMNWITTKQCKAQRRATRTVILTWGPIFKKIL